MNKIPYFVSYNHYSSLTLQIHKILVPLDMQIKMFTKIIKEIASQLAVIR